MAKTTVFTGTADQAAGRSIVKLSDGTLIAMSPESVAANLMFYDSDDDGATWSDTSSDITEADVTSAQVPNFCFTVDEDDVLWCTYENATDHKGYVRRGVYSGGAITWDSGYIFNPTLYTSDKMAMVAFKISTDTYVAINANVTSTCQLAVVKRTSGGTYSTSHSLSTWVSNNPVFLGIDFHHTGDGLTVDSSTPHLYLYAQLGAYRLVYKRFAYTSGPTWTAGPERAIVSDTSIDQNYGQMFYDGTRIVMMYPNDATDSIQVYERNEADTATTNRSTGIPSTGQSTGRVTQMFHDIDGNIYLVLSETSANYLAWAKWTRATTTWDTSWTNLESEGGIDQLYVDVHPLTLSHIYYSDNADDGYYISSHTFNSAPTAPTWTSVSGEVEDVAETLLLDWVFNDPDSDAQSDYTIRRRKGAAAYAYWNGTSWQAGEDASTKIASSVSSKTLSASWGADGDDDHYYAIKTWDPSDEVSPWSSELRVIPSAQDNPTITAPTGTVGFTATATWTATTQTAYRVVVSDTSSTSDMDAGTLDDDSGWVVDAAKTALIEFPTNSATRYFRVQTKNDEGLISDIDQETLTVSYTAPTEPTLTVSEVELGALRITIDNPAGGATVVSNEVYRRVGTEPYIRRATGVAVDGAWDDWAVTGGVTYDYKVRALGDNGTWTEGSTVT